LNKNIPSLLYTPTSQSQKFLKSKQLTEPKKFHFYQLRKLWHYHSFILATPNSARDIFFPPISPPFIITYSHSFSHLKPANTTGKYAIATFHCVIQPTPQHP